MKKAVVFGSFVVDLMARTPHLPIPAETVLGSMFKMGAGGKGFNQCVAAHKAGAPVSMSTKIAKDTFGQVALDVMEELCMPKDHMFYSEEASTGIALILVDEKTSQNEIVIVPGACNTITGEEVDSLSEAFRESDYCLLQLEVNQDANERAAKLARSCGCKVILNPAPYSPMTDEFLSQMYMVTPNEVEAEEITGIPVTDEAAASRAAAWFHARGVEIVLITLGARGVFLSDGTREMLIPAFRVEALDTTGAGDAFNGGLLAALCRGDALEKAVQYAQVVAALSVQKLGTTPAMPTLAEIEAFIKENC